MSQRKKLRAMMTQNDLAQSGVAQNAETQSANAQSADAQNAKVDSAPENAKVDDLDGWPLSKALRDELSALDLMAQPVSQEAKTVVVQVGPREQIAPQLERFAQRCGAACKNSCGASRATRANRAAVTALLAKHRCHGARCGDEAVLEPDRLHARRCAV
jgi:hypothetical protein